jgi:ATP phosphoribosyltransferase
MLRIAVQKSGRLYDDTLFLLKGCDLSLALGKSGHTLRGAISNFPAEILYMRDDDIPAYIAVVESKAAVNIAEKLSFSHCRLSLAAPKSSQINLVKDLQGKRIATTYPNILEEYLKKAKIQAEIHLVSGSVELTPSLGMADAICDLVGSGSTLIQNGLREIEAILHSQAVVILPKKLDKEKELLVARLLFRIRAVEKAEKFRYILMNVPNCKLKNVISVLPGLKSPTIVPLAESDWSAVHTVIEVEKFWDKIESLREAGAEGILVTKIDKLI